MYTLKQKNLSLNENYDVVVVGGGPAGCTAAASSAREGAKTLLIEATGALGGMGTNGLVPAWCPFSDKEKIIYRGLAEKVFNDTKAGMKHIKAHDLDWVAIDAERLKRVYDELVTSYGCDVLFNTIVCDVDVNANKEIETIIVANKQGISAYRAKVFIDCTGDADLVAFGGGEYIKGDGSKNPNLQPASLCFVFSNVDDYAFNVLGRLHGDNPNSVIHRILKEKKYPLIPDGHVIGTLVGPSTVAFNAGHIWKMDNTKPETISKGLIEGRRIAEEFLKALKEYAPTAFGNAHLVMTAPLLGIRESRRIIGDYILTVDDYAERKTFKDEICRNSYFIDVHGNADAASPRGKLSHYGKGESHGIPYRTLIPVNFNNVLVAGKTISCDRMVQGSIRVMPVCLAMGEAAGMAASHALKYHNNVRSIDIQYLRKRLIEEGVYIK